MSDRHLETSVNLQTEQLATLKQIASTLNTAEEIKGLRTDLTATQQVLADTRDTFFNSRHGLDIITLQIAVKDLQVAVKQMQKPFLRRLFGW
jgi:hypothetical protein